MNDTVELVEVEIREQRDVDMLAGQDEREQAQRDICDALWAEAARRGLVQTREGHITLIEDFEHRCYRLTASVSGFEVSDPVLREKVRKNLHLLPDGRVVYKEPVE